MPVLVSERIDPAKRTVGRIWEKLCQWTYPFADRIVIQKEGNELFFTRFASSCPYYSNPILLPPKEKSIGQT